MLVILCGADTTGRKLLSRQIVVTQNQFVIDGYRIDFSKKPYEVYDSNNNKILTAEAPTSWVAEHSIQPATFTPDTEKTLIDNPPTEDPNYYENYGDNTPVTGTENTPVGEKESINPLTPPTDIVPLDLFDKIKTLNQKILDDERDNDYKNFFMDVEYDYGIAETLEYQTRWGTPNTKDFTYEEVITNYANRAYDTFVITGNFAKGIIDKLRTDLGAENVFVLNITRNPSVAFALNKKSSDWYAANPQYTYEKDFMKLEGSIFNSINLKRFSDISTIKFEDMITSGKVVVAGAKITLPVEFDKFNNLITQYEKSVLELNLVDDNEMTAFNIKASRYQQPEDAEWKERRAEREKAFGRKFLYTDFLTWPNNLFLDLGYSQLFISEITS